MLRQSEMILRRRPQSRCHAVTSSANKFIVPIPAVLLVIGVVSLSIVPPDYRVVTDLPRPLEHLAVFLHPGGAS